MDWGYYGLAAEDFAAAIRVKPLDAKNYLARGLALQKQDQYSLALEDYETAAEVDPQSYMAYYRIGDMLFKRGDYETALNALMRSKQLNNKFVPSYELMGDILAIEDAVAAAANYMVARELDPANAAKYNKKISQMLSSEGRKEVVSSRFLG
jgi:tetratricopeptide (TPR) repeat protein